MFGADVAGELEQLKTLLRNREEVLFAYVYGSVAQERSGPLSDLDLALYIDEERNRGGRYGYQAELIAELSPAYSRELDLVLLNLAPLRLAYRVISHGRLLFVRSEKARSDFHYRTVRDYLDFKPFIAVQNSYLRQRIREGRFGGG